MQVDLDIDVDGDGNLDYMATFRPRTSRRDFGDFTSGKEIWGTMQDGLAAEGEVVEFKMPLKLIAGSEAFTLMNIRVMNGTCCKPGQWYEVDNMGPVSIARSNECETTLVEKFVRFLSLPFTGIASAPFVINGTDPDLAGARGLFINEDETKAYIVGEFSGKLSWVNINSTASAFGEVTTIADDLFVQTDVVVNRAETLAYVTSEIGPHGGRNVVSRVKLEGKMKGEEAKCEKWQSKFKQPSNIVLSQDETKVYVVDKGQGKLFRVHLESGKVTPIAEGIEDPFSVAVKKDESKAYVTNISAGPGDRPEGDLLMVDLKTKKVSPVAKSAIKGASGITLSADEKQAFVTEFGHEGGCDGRLSVININPDSTDFGKKSILATGLCGAHDVRLNRAETLLYFVEVDSSRFSVVRVNLSRIPTPILLTPTLLPERHTISGELQEDQTWSGIVRVPGDVYVPAGRTLTILPGTTVYFAANQDIVAHQHGVPLHNCPNPKVELLVDGTLLAQGTADNPIRFTSDAEQSKPGDWGGIVLTHSAADVPLRHLIVEYADQNLMIFNNCIVEESTFRYAYGGLEDCPEAQHWDVRTGLTLFGFHAVARNNEIYGNTWGIHANQGEARETAQVIENNRIYANNRSSPGFDVPNGIHVCCSNVCIQSNKIKNNTWGVEIGIGTCANVIENKFIDNKKGFVWYYEEGDIRSEASLCNNEMRGNNWDYIKLPAFAPIPQDWFRCP